MMFKIGNKIYKEEEDGQLKEYNSFFNQFVPTSLSHNDYVKANKELMPDDYLQEYYYINLYSELGVILGSIAKSVFVGDKIDKFNKAFGNMFATEEAALKKYKDIMGEG